MSTSSNPHHNKVIPAKYKMVIEEALGHYPELDKVRIVFRLASRHPVPYGTELSFPSYFKKPENRSYVITLLEKAQGPEEQALFKNLPYDAQLGVIGHELAHVVQFHNEGKGGLVRLGLRFADFYKRRETERDADIKAIEHGLGRALYTHAALIRKIEGYTQLRPELDINYLKPHEILRTISQMETGVGV